MEVCRVDTIWYTSGVIYVYRFLPKRRVSHLSINADDAWKYRYSVYDYEQSPSVAKLELEKDWQSKLTDKIALARATVSGAIYASGGF